MSEYRVHPETLAGDPFALDCEQIEGSRRTEAELAEAIHEDEAAQGCVMTPRERQAFAHGFFTQDYSEEVHHCVPRCLLRLHDRATNGDLDGAAIEAWLEWEWEAQRWGVDVEIPREDLEALVEASTGVLLRSEHREHHESDWQRWGRRGGLRTLALYGRDWFAALAQRRQNKVTEEELAELLAEMPARLGAAS